MKKLVYSAIVFALLTGTAFAAPEKPVKVKNFKKMDADKDGKATPKEFADYWDGWFKRKDKNGDGALEFEEYDNATLLSKMDKNQDNKVDVAEHQAYRKRQFKAYDANKDGHVTLEEWTAR